MNEQQPLTAELNEAANVLNVDANCNVPLQPGGMRDVRDLLRRAAAQLAAAEREATATLDHMGASAIRVREGGGPENVWASLALSVQNLMKSRDEAVRRAEEAEGSNKVLRRTLERLYRAVSEQQYTINSRGWNIEPLAPQDDSQKWSVAGARYHQYREVDDANTDAAKVLDHEGREHALLPELIRRMQTAERERDEAVRERDGANQTLNLVMAARDRLTVRVAELEAAEREAARLRGALEELVKCHASGGFVQPDDDVLNAARAALTPTPAAGGQKETHGER